MADHGLTPAVARYEACVAALDAVKRRALRAWDALTDEEKIRTMELERDRLLAKAAAETSPSLAQWRRDDAARVQKRIDEARRKPCPTCGGRAEEAESRASRLERELAEARGLLSQIGADVQAFPAMKARAETAESEAATVREALRRLHVAVGSIRFGEDADKRTWLVSQRTKLDAVALAMADADDVLRALALPSARDEGTR